MPAAKPTEKQIERALNVWTRAGLDVGAIEIKPDGTLRIERPDGSPIAKQGEESHDKREPIPWT